MFCFRILFRQSCTEINCEENMYKQNSCWPVLQLSSTTRPLFTYLRVRFLFWVVTVCTQLTIVSKEHSASNFSNFTSAYGSILFFQEGGACRTRPRNVLTLETLMCLLSVIVTPHTGVRLSFILFVVYVPRISQIYLYRVEWESDISCDVT